MSDEKMREAFEAEFSPPVIIRYCKASNRYIENDSSDEAQECAFNQQLQWQAWQAAQRQGGEAVYKEAHTIACMYASHAMYSLKERGCTDEQLDNWFRILNRALKPAPQPAVPKEVRHAIDYALEVISKHGDGVFGPGAMAVLKEFTGSKRPEPPEDST